MLDALRSPRLTLEPLLANHAALLSGSIEDAALYEHTPEEPPVSLSTLAERYGWFESRRSPDGSEDWLNWAVRIGDGDGPYVGYVQATIRADRSATIAYFVFAAFQGQGYGREAVGAMVDFLIDKADVRSITAYIDSRNKRSLALVESLGFRKVEFLEAAHRFKGRVSDEWVYQRVPEAS